MNDAPDNAQRDRQYVVSCDGAPETRFDTLDAALRQAAQAVTLEAFDAGDDADAGPAQAAIRVQIACVRPGQEPERCPAPVVFSHRVARRCRRWRRQRVASVGRLVGGGG